MRPATQVILFDNYEAQRRQFLDELKLVMGATPVACYMPHRDDNLTSLCPYSGRVWTADASMAGQITPLGKGSLRVFNGTTNYLTTPDTANLSFGNGVVDSPVSMIVVANVTDTALTRYFFSKGNTVATDLEYIFAVNGSDFLVFSNNDSTTQVQATRTSDAAITQGSWQVFTSTYSGLGGATAANGMLQYQNGALFASTATNNAAYVALRDLAAALLFGQRNSASFLTGSAAFAAIVPVLLSAAQVTAATTICKGYFQI